MPRGRPSPRCSSRSPRRPFATTRFVPKPESAGSARNASRVSCRSPSPILRLLVADGSEYESELARIPGILRTIADVNASRRIEPMAMDEQHTETRQRLAAPAFRRPGAVRTECKLDWQAHPGPHAGERCLDVGERPRAFGNRRL